MGRMEENKEIIDYLVRTVPKQGSYEELNKANLAAIASAVVDISKSLAIIADKITEGEEWK